MILDATTLSHFQQCARRSALELAWHPRLWRPKSLFDRQFRQSVFLLSNGENISTIIPRARAEFMSRCANPGLDLPPGANPFIIAKDWAMMLEMTLRSVSRMTLLTLRPMENIPLDEDISWRTLSMSDESGSLHQWVTVDHWDRDSLSRHVHGWHVFGDMAIARRNMTLHVIEIGHMRDLRRHSCWTRGFRHKLAPNLPLKFSRPEAKAGDYEPVFLADQSQRGSGGVAAAEGWVDTLLSGGEIQKHIKHVTLEGPSDEICEDTLRQVIQEGHLMSAIKGSASADAMAWSEIPMSRSACDGMVPCPFQGVCYRWPVESPDEVEGYERRRELSQERRQTVTPVPISQDVLQ